jgi:CRISPR-associated protein Csd1
MDTTVGHIKDRVAAWFRGQAIVDAWGDEPRPWGIPILAAATVRDPKKIPALTYRGLLHAALSGAPLPWSLLTQTLQRVRVRSVNPKSGKQKEDLVTHPQAALIKLFFTTHHLIEEDTMVALQEDHPEAAYQCGRLLAVLEDIQYAADKEVGATIIDRFYGTASSAPASVFGRLLRGAQPHLSKLEPPAEAALQNRLAEILGRIDAQEGFPKTLDLQQQGFFALGYYHQRAAARAARIEAKKAKEAKKQKKLLDQPLS